MLCRKSSILFDVTIENITDMYKSGKPESYHSVTSFLSEVLLKIESLKEAIHSILNIIALVASGSSTYFLE